MNDAGVIDSPWKAVHCIDLRKCLALECNSRKSGAASESRIPDARHTVRHCHTHKISAIVKHIILDNCYRIWYRYVCKLATISKCTSSNI